MSLSIDVCIGTARARLRDRRQSDSGRRALLDPAGQRRFVASARRKFRTSMCVSRATIRHGTSGFLSYVRLMRRSTQSGASGAQDIRHERAVSASRSMRQDTDLRVSVALSAQLSAAETRRIERVRGSARSAATKRAYSSDWALFTTWCESRGSAQLPASPMLCRRIPGRECRRRGRF